jgi:hypothetical protein
VINIYSKKAGWHRITRTLHRLAVQHHIIRKLSRAFLPKKNPKIQLKFSPRTSACAKIEFKSPPEPPNERYGDGFGGRGGQGPQARGECGGGDWDFDRRLPRDGAENGGGRGWAINIVMN